MNVLETAPVVSYATTRKVLTDPTLTTIGVCHAALQPRVYALRPRVAILSMGADGHPLEAGAKAAALDMVHSSPGLEGIWQTNSLVGGGEKGHNAPEQFCANVGKSDGKAEYIGLLAEPDGAFRVTKSRNGCTKRCAARE